jgi:hypothetical protein
MENLANIAQIGAKVHPERPPGEPALKICRSIPASNCAREGLPE